LASGEKKRKTVVFLKINSGSSDACARAGAASAAKPERMAMVANSAFIFLLQLANEDASSDGRALAKIKRAFSRQRSIV
jgi:hypothetical protein